MIKVEKGRDKVLACVCDVCKKDLMCDDIAGQANFGLLRADFGWGSRLDDDPYDFHLCEDCWERALKVLGLAAPPSPHAQQFPGPASLGAQLADRRIIHCDACGTATVPGLMCAKCFGPKT